MALNDIFIKNGAAAFGGDETDCAVFRVNVSAENGTSAAFIAYHAVLGLGSYGTIAFLAELDGSPEAFEGTLPITIPPFGTIHFAQLKDGAGRIVEDYVVDFDLSIIPDP